MPTGYIIITIEVSREDERWVSVCKELGTSMFGDTIDEAVAAIREAVEMQLNALERCGEIPRFFEENGITFHRTRKPRRLKPEPIDVAEGVFVEREQVPVPIG